MSDHEFEGDVIVSAALKANTKAWTFEVKIQVTTCLENLEMSGNLTAVREMSGILLKIREISGNCEGKKFVRESC